MPTGEDPAAHGHWYAFTDLYHAMPYHASSRRKNYESYSSVKDIYHDALESRAPTGTNPLAVVAPTISTSIVQTSKNARKERQSQISLAVVDMNHYQDIDMKSIRMDIPQPYMQYLTGQSVTNTTLRHQMRPRTGLQQHSRKNLALIQKEYYRTKDSLNNM